MLTKRIVPCLDVKDGRVVKGVQFVSLRDAGDPVEVAAAYDAQGADEICFLDIGASPDGRGTILDVVSRTAARVFAPLTVGGGVRSVDDVRALLLAGADKVAINTAAVARPELVREASDKFGRQAIVVAVDAKRREGDGGAKRRPGEEGAAEALGWRVFTHGGRTPTDLDALAWCDRLVELGAGELLVTSMDRDGTGQGYDLELLAAITRRVSVPVVASGGVGTLAHLVEGIQQGGADAVLAASIFHFGQHTLAEARAALAARGVPVRGS